MASAAEQLASSINFGALSKATELKQRIWYTLGILIVARIGAYIPLPGIDAAAVHAPYTSASIIMQLLTSVSPTLEAWKKEGESGRRKINQWTRYGTLLLALAQSLGIANGLQNMTGPSGSAVTEPGLFFLITTMVTLSCGTMFLMWLGEQITARGIGNGISLII